VTVTLRQPPPLATPLAVEPGGESSVRIHHGRTLIAEAASSPGSPALEIPGPVSLAEARTAAGRARYYSDPFFPACFVCGPGRQLGDGLRIFPGPVAGRPLWAAPWTPDPSVTDASGRVRPEVVWAALDCPSGIAAAEAADLGQDTAILLGRMTASLAVLPAAGDQYRVIAWPGERDGRKLTAGSALLGRGGQVLELLPREFHLLEYLMRHAGQVVTRTMLLENVWDYHFDPQTNVIDVHISRLRQRIDKGFPHALLQTIRGAGYVLRGRE